MIYNGYEIKNFTELTYDESILVLKARNEDYVRKWMVDQSQIKLIDHFQFLENLKNTDKKKYYLAKKNNQIIGVYSLVELFDGKGQGGFYLTEYAIKYELAIEFLYTVIDYLFRFEDINKIFGFARVENKNVNSINKLLGFREDHELDFQKQMNYIYTSLSKNDWINTYSRNPRLLNLLKLIGGINKNEN